MKYPIVLFTLVFCLTGCTGGGGGGVSSDKPVTEALKGYVAAVKSKDVKALEAFMWPDNLAKTKEFFKDSRERYEKSITQIFNEKFIVKADLTKAVLQEPIYRFKRALKGSVIMRTSFENSDGAGTIWFLFTVKEGRWICFSTMKEMMTYEQCLKKDEALEKERAALIDKYGVNGKLKYYLLSMNHPKSGNAYGPFMVYVRKKEEIKLGKATFVVSIDDKEQVTFYSPKKDLTLGPFPLKKGQKINFGKTECLITYVTQKFIEK